ncbi:MAG: competence type IV pilus major pilin ComGC [Candidatus Saccharibacteria bacterium]
MISNKKDEKNNKGFTIIELLAVMVILGVIAAIVVPKYAGAMDKSKQKACTNNLNMLNHAVELFQEVEESDPADQQTLKNEGYINKIVYCPVDGDDYVFNANVFSCNGH